jgi:hypothetical protein
MSQINSLLPGLREDAAECRIVYGSTPTSDTEIALLIRSISEVLTDISSTVHVPNEDVAEQRVPPTVEPEGDGINPDFAFEGV